MVAVAIPRSCYFASLKYIVYFLNCLNDLESENGDGKNHFYFLNNFFLNEFFQIIFIYFF